MPDSHTPTSSQPPARRARRRAFTLLELIVVLVVLGIIALIAIPTFSRIIGGSAERTALTTAQAIARSAQGQASLKGDDATNTYLTRAALEVELPAENLQLAWRAGGGANTGVIGVKATTSGDNNTRYACVFIAPVVSVDTARFLAEPAGADGACPSSSAGGDLNANSVAPSGTLTYTSDISSQLGGGGGGAPDLVAALYVCDALPGAGGGAWDDFSVTHDGGNVMSANFNGAPGALSSTGPWMSISEVTGILPSTQVAEADGAVAGHPSGGAACSQGTNGGVALTQAPDSGTIGVKATLAAPPSATGAVLALVIFDITNNDVVTELVLPGDTGGIGVLLRSPDLNNPFGFYGGPFGAGAQVELRYDTATNTSTVFIDGSDQGSFS